jgi:xanthine/uracil/vitamin C permease (AzgA family)
MSYILAINPAIFSEISMPAGAVFTFLFIDMFDTVGTLVCGNFKKLTTTMYILATLFILKYIFI